MNLGDVRTLKSSARIWKMVDPRGRTVERFPGGVGRDGAMFVPDTDVIIFETAEYWVQVLYVSKKGLELGWVRKEYLK